MIILSQPGQIIKKETVDPQRGRAAGPQPKILYWTQMNTDKHRFYIRKNLKKKNIWTRMNTDTHGSFLKKKTETGRLSQGKV
jgi:hypothetical protein